MLNTVSKCKAKTRYPLKFLEFEEMKMVRVFVVAELMVEFD